ncbi:MAG: hypothetical protein ACFE0J_11430 [Elainellaceae cyanobacterium]
MLFPRPRLTSIRRIAAALIVGLIVFSSIFIEPAHAEGPPLADTYISADGRDLTVVAECIPSQLSEGDLGRALRESGNDFLEKVFGVKQNYDEYKLDTTEIEFLECLKRNGVTPQVKQTGV